MSGNYDGFFNRFLITSAGLIGRDGAIISKGHVSEAKDLGLGFISVVTDSGKYVLHDSGFKVEKFPVEDAKLLANHFIAMEKNILLLTDGGQLILFAADPKEFREIGRAQVCGQNWCNPAYATGKLFLRDMKYLYCVELQ